MNSFQIGIVIASIFVVLLLILIIALVVWSKQQQQQEEEEEEERVSVQSQALGPIRQPSGQQQILVLRNYNLEGGFFWQLWNVLHMLAVAEEQNLKPIVLFDQGLYLETRPEFRAQIPVYDPLNWFNHFFEPINETSFSQEQVLEQLKYLRPWRQARRKKNTQKIPGFIFDRHSLSARILKPPELKRLWQTWIHPRKHILAKVQQFPLTATVGIHYRGTDKLPGKAGTEDHPLHCAYAQCLTWLRQELHSSGTSTVFVATDEQPLIDFLRQELGPDQIEATDCLRSGVSTSGFNLDTSACSKGDRASFECCRYNDLIQESVHRGMPTKSKYQKGEEVLVDMLLLAQCSTFLRSKGNVSNFVTYLNPKAKIINMTQRCRASKKTKAQRIITGKR